MVQIASPPPRASGSERRQSYSWWQQVRANLYDVESSIAIALLAIILLVNVAYNFAKGPRDLTTLAFNTLEYLDLQAFSNVADNAGRLILIFNILFYVLFAQNLLDIVQSIVRRRPEARQVGLAQTMRDHVIVCGLGRIGYRIITRLAAGGYQVVVIQQDLVSDFVHRTADLRIPIIQGDAREQATLERAGARHACAVIACIDGDLVNLEIAVAARKANPNVRVILRAFGEDFDRGFERSFGANTAFSHSRLAAPTLGAAAVTRHLEHVMPVGATLVGVTQVILPKGTDVAAFEAQYGVRVVDQAAQDGGKTQVTLLGTIPGIVQLNAAAGGAPVHGDGTIIICGLGKVGYRAVRLLHGLRNQMAPPLKIVVIHRDDDGLLTIPTGGTAANELALIDSGAGRSFTKMIRDLDDVQILLGDARDPDLLRRAGIERASAVLAITSDDEVNVQIGLEARNIRDDIHVVLRVFSDSLAEKLGDLFGIHTAYSTSNLASPTMAAAAVVEGVSEAFVANDTLFGREEFAVTAGNFLTGATAGRVRKERGGAVLAMQRGDALTVLPADDVAFQPGDRVTLVADLRTLARLRQSLAISP